MDWTDGGFTISDDPARIDTGVVHRFLSGESYWAGGIPIELVRQSIENSLPFGLYEGAAQIGFARVITDYATFAYIADVFILEAYRGRGLSKWLMRTIREHPRLQGLRRWLLVTKDAHGLYAGAGFVPLLNPERWMEIRDMNVYKR